MLVLFCLSRLTLLSSMSGCKDAQGVLAQNRTKQPNQTVCNRTVFGQVNTVYNQKNTFSVKHGGDSSLQNG